MRLSFIFTTFFALSLSHPLLRDKVLLYGSDISGLRDRIEALASRSTGDVACVQNQADCDEDESGTRLAMSLKQAGPSQADTDSKSKGKMSSPKVQAVSSTDPQESLTLDPAVIAKGFAKNGLNTSEPGQVASLTSKNNFINFCKAVKLPITNGRQLGSRSCNPAPMGMIPSNEHYPSSKFVFPKNGGTLKANKTFRIQMVVRRLATGNFVNAETNYFAAPQQLDSEGNIKGHSHVVAERLTSLDQTTPTDPRKFAFFKGLNDKAQKDVLTADVVGGLPAGFYRISSINTAANHQPILVGIAQHGALDDMIYIIIQ